MEPFVLPAQLEPLKLKYENMMVEVRAETLPWFERYRDDFIAEGEAGHNKFQDAPPYGNRLGSYNSKVLHLTVCAGNGVKREVRTTKVFSEPVQENFEKKLVQ
eukprot:Blabericola_migrator_1__10640@NODE_6062_length_609_cov_21_824723_g4046_i0_p1_GENE_NODE_6062_length_609_cov_21_824723_g4046_i0NODE_6062_length_609_cov_21_824723_g4046_i0_p1_ORF_typecomplete_len103_score12_75_NODE_6062_length_609_cov_21_824723_g4046_i0242550